MSAEGDLLRAVQEKLADKEELILEQQKQITELEGEIERLRTSGGGLSSSDDEKDELIHEQMMQIVQLEEEVENLQTGGASSKDLKEKDAVIEEQMQQIIEFQDTIDALERRLSELT